MILEFIVLHPKQKLRSRSMKQVITKLNQLNLIKSHEKNEVSQ